MDKVLVTGGSGFIGTNLLEYLISQELDILNLDKVAPVLDGHSRYWVECDLLEKKSVLAVITSFKPSIIIHLAARTDCDSNELVDYVDNTDGTKNLISCIEQVGFVKKLIVASTQYVYKSKSCPFPIADDEYLPHTTYGESKVITEKIVREANLDCCWTLVRPTNVWGPWHMRYPNELWKMIAKGFYLHPGSSEVIRTYGYVKNIVHQLFEIMNSPRDRVDRRTFYLGDLPIDSYTWLNGFSLAIRKRRLRRIPVFLFALPSVFGTMLRALGIRFPLYNTRFKNMREDYYAPTNITINEFGLYSSDIKRNIDETVQWLRSSGVEYFPFWRNWFNIS